VQYTREQLEALPTPELVRLYNTIAGKSVKRFSSREAGIKALLSAIAARAQDPTVRTVRGSASIEVPVGSKAGRPPVAFSVTLCEEGKSDVHGSSLRGQILAFLKTLSTPTLSILELERKFGVKARGAVHKLASVGWLKKHQ
jgi:hypothetical protein